MFFRFVFSVVLSVVILAACGPSPEQQAAMTATAATATAAAWTATFTATATATHTPTITPTYTPAPTDTPTRVPTRTPAPTRPPTRTPPATDTPDPKRYDGPDGAFSLVAPYGWKPGGDNWETPTLVGPRLGGMDLSLAFWVEDAPDTGIPALGDMFGVAFLSAAIQDLLVKDFKNYKQIREDFLETDAGVSYFRWEFTQTYHGNVIHQVYYLFVASSKTIMMIYTRPKDYGVDLDAVVDQAIQTVRLKK